MALRKEVFIENEYYHIYNRGVSKQSIFHDKQDYERFLGLLFLCNQEQPFKVDTISRNIPLINRNKTSQDIVAVGAYVLMPNHFHILLTQTKEGGVIRFMRKVSTAYAMYYNKKYKRTGALFEGKFKAEHASSERYLKYLFSYIHLNPLKMLQKDWKEKGIKNTEKALAYLREYKYSSFLDYNRLSSNRKESIILNKKPFPPFFAKEKDFNHEVFSWLSYKQTPLGIS